MRLRRRHFGFLLLLASSLFFAFAIGELVLRYGLGYPRTFPAIGLFEPDDRRTYRLAPDFQGTYVKGGARFRVETNEAGFRDPRDFGALVDGAAKRMLAIGDSFVFGMPVEQDQTFVAVLERELVASTTPGPWEVFNLGVPSYGTLQEAIVLEELTPVLRPSAVLLAFCMANDFSDNEFPPDASSYRAHGGLQVTPGGAAAAAGFWGGLAFRTRVTLSRFAAYQIIRDRWAPGTPPSEPELGSLERSARAVARVQEFCHTRGIQLFVVLIPKKREVLRGRESLTTTRFGELLEEREIHYYDPTDDLRANPEPEKLFEQHGSHFTVDGNELLGRLLVRHVGPLLSTQ